MIMNEKLIIEIIEVFESNMVGIMDKATIAENLQELLPESKDTILKEVKEQWESFCDVELFDKWLNKSIHQIEETLNKL